MGNHAVGITAIVEVRCLQTANNVKLEIRKEVHLSFRI